MKARGEAEQECSVNTSSLCPYSPCVLFFRNAASEEVCVCGVGGGGVGALSIMKLFCAFIRWISKMIKIFR